MEAMEYLVAVTAAEKGCVTYWGWVIMVVVVVWNEHFLGIWEGGVNGNGNEEASSA